MKYFVNIILIIFLSYSTTINALEKNDTVKRNKIALVLSGGGAKGMAHIGALEVISKIGLPIDYIVGTSMGSIIGGLTAIGYTSHDIDSMVRVQNWQVLLSDKIPRRDQNMDERETAEKYVISMPFSTRRNERSRGGLIKARNITNLLSNLTLGYHDSINFKNLPIPFACVACNIVNGKQVVFKEGILPRAIRASMAIPGVFTPVRIDSLVLVDGGVINNYPVNVAKELGANIIIGVDVQGDLHNENELNTTGNILGQLISLLGQKVYEENIKQTNIYIKVDVEGYSAASFTPNAIDTLIERGRVAALKEVNALYKLKDSLGYSKNFKPTPIPSFPFPPGKKIYIKQIKFDGNNIRDVKWILRKCKIKNNSYISIQEIERVANFLCANLGFSSATYSIPKNGNGYNLIYYITKRHQNMLNLGIRFDTEEIASLLVNVTSNFNTRIPTSLSLSGRLGKRYEAKVKYTLEPKALQRINMGYTFQYNNIDYYELGRKDFNSISRFHKIDLNYSNIWINNFKLKVGLNYELYDYDRFLFPDTERKYDVGTEHFFTYYSELIFDNLNKAFFPSEGISSKIRYCVFTDNLTSYNGKTPFSSLEGIFQTVLPISDRFKVLPMIAGRIIFGSDIPFSKLNVMGGEVPERFFSRELPFIGINNIEIMKNALVIGGLRFREKIGTIHYVSFNTNYAISGDKLNKLFNQETRFGCGLSYGIDTIFGPLEAYLNYQNKADKFSIYINIGYKF